MSDSLMRKDISNKARNEHQCHCLAIAPISHFRRNHNITNIGQQYLKACYHNSRLTCRTFTPAVDDNTTRKTTRPGRRK
jgi:hypothetical protein